MLLTAEGRFAVFQCLFRISLAALFFRAGVGKVVNWELTKQLFQDEFQLPLLPPQVALGGAVVLEIACALLLVSGLVTRFTAMLLLSWTALVQIWVYPTAWVEHLMWTSILLFILVYGGGRVSLDHVLRSSAARGRLANNEQAGRI